MDVYLDESVKHGLRVHRLMGGHTVSTAVYMKWAGLPNGEWMKLAHEAGFQVVVTTDQSIPPQQNLTRYRFGIVVLSKTNFEVTDDNVTKIVDAIDSVPPHDWKLVELD